jgi:hypothetical protein
MTEEALAVTALAFSSTADLAHVCDDVADDLLRSSGCDSPPVNALRLAEELGYEVAFDAAQAGRGRFKRLCGRPTVLLTPDARPERVQWAAAHELGESLAGSVFDLLDIDPEEADPVLRERTATTLATSILLPRRWFFEDALRLGGDVPGLKSIYSTASHELILSSLLRLETLTLISVFDHGRMTRRRTNGQLNPPPLLLLEREAQGLAHESGEAVTLRGRGVIVQAWPVHEPGWKRELLRTTPLDGDGDEQLD